MVNVLSPPPTPSPEVPIEFAATTHCNGHLNLPGFGNSYNAKTPEPTLNSLQAVWVVNVVCARPIEHAFCKRPI